MMDFLQIVGDVAIRSGEKSFNVIVKPTITLFNDPSLQFGANIIDILSVEFSKVYP